MFLVRKLPINIIEKDKYLFDRENSVKINTPQMKVQYFVLADLFNLKVFKHKIYFNSVGIKYDKLKIRDVINLKIKFCFTCSIIFDKWSQNYFHWITEALPKLMILDYKKQNSIVYVPNYYLDVPYIAETLKKFQNIHFKIVSFTTEKKYLFWKVQICDLRMNSGNYHPDIITNVTLFLKNSFLNSNHFATKKVKRIFIFRGEKSTRKIINYFEIIPILHKYGFEILNFDSYTVKSQIQLLSNCDILIGVHGAGLTNMIMQKPGSVVVEIRRYDDSLNNCYFSLSSLMKHKYYYLLCKVNDERLLTQQNDFIIDPIKFEELLNYSTAGF